MAPAKRSSQLPSSSPISIGNCEVSIEAQNFKSEPDQNSLQISLSKNAKIKISVVEGTRYRSTNSDIPVLGTEDNGDYYFALVNPKDSGDRTKFLLKEALDLFSKELPAMNYAANTGKASMFLERCVSNGKYCTLLLKFTGNEEEAVAAITYQIVPADTQYAEIPLAAVRMKYQKKGIGRLMYMELRKRLQRVGIRTILCWGDSESEGFWLKQGFVVIGEVNKRGRARRLPIKSDIRKALCFPGGSTLMVSHLGDNAAYPEELTKLSLPLKPQEKHYSSDIILKQQHEHLACELEPSKVSNQIVSSPGDSPPDDMILAKFLKDDCPEPLSCWNMFNDSGEPKSDCEADEKRCSCSGEQTKKRMWEATNTSLKSKKVKGGHTIDCQTEGRNSISGSDIRSYLASKISGFSSRNKILGEDTMTSNCLEKNVENCESLDMISEHHRSCEGLSMRKCLRVFLMNIADDKKKLGLTKIIEDLGGTVTSDGALSTHMITGKVRKTMNFCVALCSGAWIISPSWLKESFHKGRFVDEIPFILEDEDYECKYGTELKLAVLRARAKPNCLLEGYDLCLAAHVQPSVLTLSAIVKSAGGNVIHGLDKAKESWKAIFIAGDEDVEEATLAKQKGIRTFSSDWLMNCIMTQHLDLVAPKFA